MVTKSESALLQMPVTVNPTGSGVPPTGEAIEVHIFPSVDCITSSVVAQKYAPDFDGSKKQNAITRVLIALPFVYVEGFHDRLFST